MEFNHFADTSNGGPSEHSSVSTPTTPRRKDTHVNAPTTDFPMLDIDDNLAEPHTARDLLDDMLDEHNAKADNIEDDDTLPTIEQLLSPSKATFKQLPSPNKSTFEEIQSPNKRRRILAEPLHNESNVRKWTHGSKDYRFSEYGNGSSSSAQTIPKPSINAASRLQVANEELNKGNGVIPRSLFGSNDDERPASPNPKFLSAAFIEDSDSDDSSTTIVPAKLIRRELTPPIPYTTIDIYTGNSTFSDELLFKDYCKQTLRSASQSFDDYLGLDPNALHVVISGDYGEPDALEYILGWFLSLNLHRKKLGNRRASLNLDYCDLANVESLIFLYHAALRLRLKPGLNDLSELRGYIMQLVSDSRAPIDVDALVALWRLLRNHDTALVQTALLTYERALLKMGFARREAITSHLRKFNGLMDDFTRAQWSTRLPLVGIRRKLA